MKHVKNYLPLQVLLLCALSVENRSAIKKGLRVATIPRVVSGPGKIIDISKESLARNDESKDINDLLYQVYRQFKKDAKKQATGDFTKAEVVKKTEMPNMQPKLVKKEKHQIALKELERTIDKLIASLTRVDDGKFEEKEINKGIEDMSKFVHVDGIADITSSREASSLKEDGKAIDYSKEFGSKITYSGNQVSRATVYQDELKEFDNFKQLLYNNFARSNMGKSIIFHEKKASKGHLTPLRNNLARIVGVGVTKLPYLGANEKTLLNQAYLVGDQSTGMHPPIGDLKTVFGVVGTKTNSNGRVVNPIGGDQKTVVGGIIKQHWVGDQVIKHPPPAAGHKSVLGDAIRKRYLVGDQVIKHPPPAAGHKSVLGYAIIKRYLVGDQVLKHPPHAAGHKSVLVDAVRKRYLVGDQVVKHPPPAGNTKTLSSPELHISGDMKVAQSQSIIPLGDPMESKVLPSGNKIFVSRDSRRRRKLIMSGTIGDANSSGGRKEEPYNGDLHRNEGHDQKIINSGKKDYMDLHKKAGRYQVLRTNTIGKNEAVSDGYLYRKPHTDQINRIPKVGKKEFVRMNMPDMYRYLRKHVLRQSKSDAVIKDESKQVNLDNGEKLEKITIALVELFNYVNDKELFSYEKKKKKVERISSFLPSVETQDRQSKLKTLPDREGKITVQTKPSLEEKLANVKYRLVDFLKFLNGEDFIHNVDSGEVVKPIPRVRVNRITDDDILEDILNDIRVGRSGKISPIMQTYAAKKLPSNNYSIDAHTKHGENNNI